MDRIALVEDHPRLAGLVTQALAAVGIPTDEFGRLEPAWRAVREKSYAVVVVDRGLPDGDGLDLVRRMRAAKLETPCLMLTARDALHDRIEGLESGADDYLAKPFPMSELVARVRALMRRTPALRSLTQAHGDMVIDPEAGCMLRGDRSAVLATAELQIMISLTKAAGSTVRRSALEAAAWGYDEGVLPGALDVALHRLRKKLLVIGSSLVIVNVRGYGYALR